MSSYVTKIYHNPCLPQVEVKRCDDGFKQTGHTMSGKDQRLRLLLELWAFAR